MPAPCNLNFWDSYKEHKFSQRILHIDIFISESIKVIALNW